jgi:pyrimidine-nucleoside phosphorylase
VKTGAGAFMTKLEDSITLAQTMIALGEKRGCKTVVLLTDMDAPLGEACGNALEIGECLLVLHGDGPKDLIDVTMALAVEMLLVAGVAEGTKSARAMAEHALRSGAALQKFKEIVQAQGGHPGVVDNPVALLPKAPIRERIEAARSGVVQRVEPRVIGRAIMALGGGRQKVEDEIDPAVGIVLKVKPGQTIERGQHLATIHARDAETQQVAEEALRRAIVIGDGAPPARPLISHRITAAGVEVLG